MFQALSAAAGKSAPAIPSISFSADPRPAPIFDQLRQLFSGDTEIYRHMADAAGGLAVNLALAAAILALTLWASGVLSRMTARAIARAHRGPHPDTTLQTFSASLVRYSVIVIGLISVLTQLGVRLTSVIAVLGAASLAIGLALQGALGNVAAGVMILILRPYRVGDRVEINGKFGIVKGLDLFATRLADLDNLAVFVPNGKAFGEIIVNYSATPSHRIEVDAVIDFDDDLDRALEVMTAAALSDPRVLRKPRAPLAKLKSIEDRGLKVMLRAWVTPADWLEARFDLIKTVYQALRAEGFSIPYPHQVAVGTRPFVAPHSKPAADPPGPEATEPRSFAPPERTQPGSPPSRG